MLAKPLICMTTYPANVWYLSIHWGYEQNQNWRMFVVTIYGKPVDLVHSFFSCSTDLLLHFYGNSIVSVKYNKL